MNLIKPCPWCGQKLRFPITKGKIKVTCSCGESFIADPDSTSLYLNAIFDMGPKPKKSKSGFSKSIRNRLKGLSIHDRKRSIIAGIYGIAYKLQNFRLLSGAEQRKIVASIVLILFIIVSIVYIIVHGGKAPLPTDGPTI